METNPEQSTENSTADDATPPEIEPTPAPEPAVEPVRPVATAITEIESLGDAKEFFTDGFYKLRNSSADDFKKTGLKAVNRIARAWRTLWDGD